MTSPTPPEPAPAGPVAGWYPDQNEGKLRYWDGSQWTEHLTPYPEGDPAAPPPPAAGDIVVPGANDQDESKRLRPIGEWLSETFKLVIDQAGHLFTLIVVLTLAIDLVAAASTWMASRGLVVTLPEGETPTVTGANAWLAVALVVSVLSMVSKIVLGATAARHVLAARTGVPESWSDTLRESLPRLPRLLGSIVIFLGVTTIVYLGAAIVLGVFALVPVLSIFGLIGAILVLLAGLARIGFSPLMVLIAPPGNGGIRRSIALTKGATRDLIRRLLMLAMIGFTMIVIAGLFTSPLIGADTELVSTDTTLDVGAAFGDNPGAFGLGQVISGLVASAFTALIGGGLGLLYAELGGPIDDSITDVDPNGVPEPGLT